MNIIAEVIASLPDLIFGLPDARGTGKKEGTSMRVRVDSDLPALNRMEESREIRATSQRIFRSNQ